MGFVADAVTGKPVYNDTSNTQADLQAAADFAEKALGDSVDTAGDLPVDGGRSGRQIWVKDEECFYAWTGSTWLTLASPVLGVAVLSTTQLLTTSAADIAGLSLTITTPSVPIRLRTTVQLNNAGSGADRTASLRIWEDGVAIGISRTFSVPIISTGSMAIGEITISRTPSAGTHVYKVQALASAATSVTIGDCDLEAIRI